MPEQPEKKFTIIGKRAPDYKIYPAGIIYGGPTPDSQSILMNVCVDHSAFPNYTQHQIVDGRVDMSVVQDQAMVGDVEREILCGILLSTDQAKKLVGWLAQNLEKIERNLGGQPD